MPIEMQCDASPAIERSVTACELGRIRALGGLSLQLMLVSVVDIVREHGTARAQ